MLEQPTLHPQHTLEPPFFLPLTSFWYVLFIRLADAEKKTGETHGTTSEPDEAVESTGVGVDVGDGGATAASVSVSDVAISATTTAVVSSVTQASDSASIVAQVTKARATTSAAVKTKGKPTTSTSTSDSRVVGKSVIVKPQVNRTGTGTTTTVSTSGSGISKKSPPTNSHTTGGTGDKKPKPK